MISSVFFSPSSETYFCYGTCRCVPSASVRMLPSRGCHPTFESRLVWHLSKNYHGPVVGYFVWNTHSSSALELRSCLYEDQESSAKHFFQMWLDIEGGKRQIRHPQLTSGVEILVELSATMFSLRAFSDHVNVILSSAECRC
jgi:hypothetical protein